MNWRSWMVRELPSAFALAVLTALVTLSLAIGLSAVIGGDARLAREETRCYNAAILVELHELREAQGESPAHGSEHALVAGPRCQSILRGEAP